MYSSFHCLIRKCSKLKYSYILSKLLNRSDISLDFFMFSMFDGRFLTGLLLLFLKYFYWFFNNKIIQKNQIPNINVDNFIFSQNMIKRFLLLLKWFFSIIRWSVFLQFQVIIKILVIYSCIQKSLKVILLA